ncbi:MAG: hypothetical protein EBS29_11315, partial [Chloroflexia bacterium]|nr:hypothetical protein [Chloroflexia bacterium]
MNSAPNTCPAIERYQICDYKPKERFAAIYMEPNHPMSYGAFVAPFPGTDSSLMFWARLDDASNNSYPLVQSVTNPYVNRPSVSWTGNTHTLQYANLAFTWNNYDNKWHLFTFVKRGATLELYIDNNRVIEGAAPAGLQPFRVAAGSTINVGGVSGGEIAAVELSPLAYPNDYIKWRYENGIPNFATAQPTITPQNTLTPTASPTVTASMTPTGTFSSATRTWYKLTVVNPILTAISSDQTAVASATQAAQQGINNALTTTRVVQLQTQVANDGQTATSVSQTQVAANATATSLVATEAAQLRATLAGTAIKTATRPIIVVPTFIIIGFPTLFPTYTNTPTVTNSPTRNASFTATRTRTVTASRTATSTYTNTRTVTRTVSRTSTRTRMSTPTFVTMTATVTMSPTAISTMYGPDTVFINRLPAGMLARALQFIQDQRMNPCSSKDIACPADDWRDPVINDVAIPFYRPDIMGGAMPAYYELSLYDRTTKQPK